MSYETSGCYSTEVVVEIIQTICTCFHVTNHNECGAVVYSHGTVGCLKNNRTISIKKLEAFGCLPVLVTAGAGWSSEGAVSSVLAGLSGCWVGAVAHKGCGLPVWHSYFPLTEEGQRYLHLFLESLQSVGSCVVLDRKHFMCYLKFFTRIHSRHFLSSEV